MKDIYRKLLISFLKELKENQSNCGCNDWNFPKSWTKKDVREFYEIAIENGVLSEDELTIENIKERYMADFVVTETLIEIVKGEK